MKRTVFTWGIGYRRPAPAQHSPSGGLNIRFVMGRSDGGPYECKDDCQAAAMRARWELMDLHGRDNVGRFEIQSHQAPVEQPAFPAGCEGVRTITERA